MGARHRQLLVGVSLAIALWAPVASAAGDPRGFRGTISVHYALQAAGSSRPGGKTDGSGTFSGTYRVSGGRYRGRGAPPRSYLLTGSGQEQTKVFRIDSFSDTGTSSEFSLSAVANGAVRLVKTPRSARQAGGPILQLKPHGRFTLALVGLDGGTDGVPLSYRIDWKHTNDCLPDPGNDIKTAVYDEGQLVQHNTEVCPGATPDPDRTTGIHQQESLWGENVWNSHARTPRPDLCGKRLSLVANPFLCGKLRGGAARGHIDIGKPLGSWSIPGSCPFQPWGPGGLQDPLEDGIYSACMNLDVNDPAWRQVLTIDYKLKPAGR